MLIHVKVEADSKEDKVTEKNDTSYVVEVKESAERNLANSKMLYLLAGHLHLSQDRLRIITGHHSPSKILDIVGKGE